MHVVAGGIKLNSPEGEEERVNINKIIGHPDYNNRDLTNDICLLKVDIPLLSFFFSPPVSAFLFFLFTFYNNRDLTNDICLLKVDTPFPTLSLPLSFFFFPPVTAFFCFLLLYTNENTVSYELAYARLKPPSPSPVLSVVRAICANEAMTVGVGSWKNTPFIYHNSYVRQCPLRPLPSSVTTPGRKF